MTHTEWQIAVDLIRKYRLGAAISEHLSMNKSVFNEKLNESRTYKFTDTEKQKIRHCMVCMGKVLVGELGEF